MSQSDVSDFIQLCGCRFFSSVRKVISTVDIVILSLIVLFSNVLKMQRFLQVKIDNKYV